ncbi:MAG: hypothetical protein AAGI30_10805 [Planctomycetota bacterium]
MDTGLVVMICVATASGAAIAAAAIGLPLLNDYLQTRQRERTKREISAYVAEGSISAEEGERLIRADEFETSEPPSREQPAERE